MESFCLEYRTSDGASDLTLVGLWPAQLGGRKVGRWWWWAKGSTHPHSQCKDAASAEPRGEEGPVGTVCDGGVALLVVT